MLVAVGASLLVAVCTLVVATLDVWHLLALVVRYAKPHGGVDLTALNAQIITNVVKAVDGYLLTAVMIIFALGLYELFISRIDAAEQSEVAPRLLLIRNLDDLKDRLAKVVILILVITFFQKALSLTYSTPADLLALALGTLLVGGALWLSGRKSGGHD